MVSNGNVYITLMQAGTDAASDQNTAVSSGVLHLFLDANLNGSFWNMKTEFDTKQRQFSSLYYAGTVKPAICR